MSVSHFRMPAPAETGKWVAPRLGWEAALNQHRWGTLDIRTKQLARGSIAQEKGKQRIKICI